MWLPLGNTLTRNATVAALGKGKYANIRLMAGDSQVQATSCGWTDRRAAGEDGYASSTRAANGPPRHQEWSDDRLGAGSVHTSKCGWQTAAAAAADGVCTGMNAYSPDGTQAPTCSLEQFSAACYYFAEALTDGFVRAGETPPTIGLVGTAIGGSMIEEWMPNQTAADCAGRSVAAHDATLWTANVVPFLRMTLKGWLWYQGENNCTVTSTSFLGHFDASGSFIQPSTAAWHATFQWHALRSAHAY